MRRFSIIIFFVLFSNVCLCKNPSDTLNKRIANLERGYKRTNDSLQRELLIYKVKDNFYSDAFSSQGTLYSALMGIISTVIVAIGLGFIITRVNTVQQILQRQIDRIDEDTAILHGSNKLNFATTLLALGHHAQMEADKGYNEDRYAASIISGFQAMRQYCTAFSLKTEAISQEQINQIVNESIVCCRASMNVLSAAVEIDHRAIEQIFNFKTDLTKIIEDISLDDLVSQSVTGKVRADYYHTKDEIVGLLKSVKFDNEV